MTKCKALDSVNGRAENSQEAICLSSERAQAEHCSGSVFIDYVKQVVPLTVDYHAACFCHIFLLLNLPLGFSLDLR